MANFQRAHGTERLSGQTINVTQRSMTIALWGFLDLQRRELQVKAVNPAVTVTRRAIHGNTRLWDISAQCCTQVRVEACDVDGQVWDWVELVFLDQGAVLAQRRQALITEAMRHVGAHYLWGAAGATPGGHDGMPGRPGSVRSVPDRLDAANPCLHAASCAVAGLHVCAGRYKTLGDRVLQPNQMELRQYIEGLRGTPPEQWQPLNTLWPRMMEGSTVTRQIVLGESCVGVRHFDCVGFINYCFSTVFRQPIQRAIDQWINESPEVTDRSDMAGDILTKGNNHIGLALGDGRVVHASQASRGVVIDQIGAGWRRGRNLH